MEARRKCAEVSARPGYYKDLLNNPEVKIPKKETVKKVKWNPKDVFEIEVCCYLHLFFP